ncbi:MAG TPA: polysaccharide biosynthesis tyrosine autokinase, partial [Gemmataceae bacterium]|nr:polysaccharide biosynthesis tyrosine autokinase [Gemmataceae bacterium]
ALQKQLEARREELRASLVSRLRQKARAEYDAALAQLQSEIGPLEKQEQDLREEVQRLAREVEKIGTSSTELEMLGADIKRDEKTATRMAEELEQLKVEQRSPSRVNLYQEAAAQRKDHKRQLLALIGAPLAAMLLVCLAVSWWEFRGRRIHTPDEVLTGLGMRVVGAVPAFPRNVSVPLLHGPDETDGHGLLESIDGIRTLLLRDARQKAMRVLMVTSAVSGEGKTTLATHLAGSLARAGRRTLLIDGDLRRPSIHQLFELPPQPGLSEVLLGEVHLAEATLATEMDGLWVIPAGQWDRNVMQALARDSARAVFEKLRSEYDFVVIDSHPVLPATDSLLLGQHADAVLFALLRDVSQMPKVYAACQRLTSLGIRVLGAVVNGTEEEVYGGYQYGVQPQQA